MGCHLPKAIFPSSVAEQWLGTGDVYEWHDNANRLDRREIFRNGSLVLLIK